MITIQRNIQLVRQGKWGEMAALARKFDPVLSRLGFPPTKRYRVLSGGHTTDTLISEVQWASMADLEAVWEKALADPEMQALGAELNAIVESTQIEYYTLFS